MFVLLSVCLTGEDGIEQTKYCGQIHIKMSPHVKIHREYHLFVFTLSQPASAQNFSLVFSLPFSCCTSAGLLDDCVAVLVGQTYRTFCKVAAVCSILVDWVRQ